MGQSKRRLQRFGLARLKIRRLGNEALGQCGFALEKSSIPNHEF